MHWIHKIVSGGQTGADRAALRWAIQNHIDHGGWCPRGRLAEDGVISDGFDLVETPSAGYSQRTEWNVRDSDATVIFSFARELSGGSLLTSELAKKWRRPLILISKESEGESAHDLNLFIEEHAVRVLNVAGPRESTEPGVGAFVAEVLSKAMNR